MSSLQVGKVTFVNLTGHILNIQAGGFNGSMLTIAKGESVARLTGYITTLEVVGGITIVSRGQITGLPEPVPGVWYITSAVLAAAAWEAGRRDVLHPGAIMRDANGVVIGCYNLVGAPVSMGRTA